MTYVPKPLDTSQIELSQELKELTELLAENVHDIWAKQRIMEGWTYGPIRDNEAKKNPSLIPYSELSESEKDYDRNTAIETLKMIIALGYSIEKK